MTKTTMSKEDAKISTALIQYYYSARS